MSTTSIVSPGFHSGTPRVSLGVPQGSTWGLSGFHPGSSIVPLGVFQGSTRGRPRFHSESPRVSPRVSPGPRVEESTFLRTDPTSTRCYATSFPPPVVSLSPLHGPRDRSMLHGPSRACAIACAPDTRAPTTPPPPHPRAPPLLLDYLLFEVTIFNLVDLIWGESFGVVSVKAVGIMRLRFIAGTYTCLLIFDYKL